MTGKADEAVEALLAGTLNYNPDIECNHPCCIRMAKDIAVVITAQKDNPISKN